MPTSVMYLLMLVLIGFVHAQTNVEPYQGQNEIGVRGTHTNEHGTSIGGNVGSISQSGHVPGRSYPANTWGVEASQAIGRGSIDAQYKEDIFGRSRSVGGNLGGTRLSHTRTDDSFGTFRRTEGSHTFGNGNVLGGHYGRDGHSSSRGAHASIGDTTFDASRRDSPFGTSRRYGASTNFGRTRVGVNTERSPFGNSHGISASRSWSLGRNGRLNLGGSWNRNSRGRRNWGIGASARWRFRG